MEISNRAVYDGVSRILDVWRSINPKSIHDLVGPLFDKELGGVRGNAFYKGSSTSLEIGYFDKGIKILSVVVPQYLVDKALIFTPRNGGINAPFYNSRQISGVFSDIPVEIAKLKNDLEEKLSSGIVDEVLAEAA